MVDSAAPFGEIWEAWFPDNAQGPVGVEDGVGS